MTRKTIPGTRDCIVAHAQAWTRHRRVLLTSGIGRASPLALALLASARATPWRASVLAMRVVYDPDWNSGFANTCTVVLRPEGHADGRLGLWAADGSLCMEAEVDGKRVIVRGPKVEVTIARVVSIPEQLLLTCAAARSITECSFLEGIEMVATGVFIDESEGTTTVSFLTGVLPFALPAPPANLPVSSKGMRRRRIYAAAVVADMNVLQNKRAKAAKRSGASRGRGEQVKLIADQ